MTMTPEEILDLPMGPNDADAGTIRDYLKALLTKLWREDEGFDGKRPFGNSGWQFDVYRALLQAGAVPGTLDEEDDISEIDIDKANALIFAAIEAM